MRIYSQIQRISEIVEMFNFNGLYRKILNLKEMCRLNPIKRVLLFLSILSILLALSLEQIMISVGKAKYKKEVYEKVTLKIKAITYIKL